MFKIFSFQFGNTFNLKNITGINGIVNSFFDNIDINGFIQNYREDFDNESYEETKRSDEANFIQLEQYKDMYLLTIDLNGIDIRELSIRYDPGIIEINLNRLEMKKRSFQGLFTNEPVKKIYNKKFENIEEIDTSQILKSIDNGILSMRMQKKYSLENVSIIVDVNSYEDNVDNY